MSARVEYRFLGPRHRKPSTFGRAVAVLAATVLAALGIAHSLTYEPAPAVDIRWRAGVTPERRAAIERRFQLVRPHDQEGRTISYDLLDTSARNIRALLAQEDVEDSGRFDPRTHTVRPDAPYGTSWIWIGNRLPLLRIPSVTPALVVLCAGVLAYGVIQRVRGRSRGRAALPGP